MEFYYLPKEYQVVHASCCELVKQIEEFIVGPDYEFLWSSVFDLSESDVSLLSSYEDAFEYLKNHKEEHFYRVLNKQLVLGLLKDFCYFMQESLSCSTKMRLVVSYALLRRPLVDNLKILLRILSDDTFYDNFIEREDYDPSYIKDEDLKKYLEDTDGFRFTKSIKGSFIYECIYDLSNAGSILNLSNRALHPVTTRPKNRTGAMNCNFMFVTAKDNEELWRHYYAYLPVILIFYSELFNSVVFALFKNEVNMDLYPKRLEKLTNIMEYSVCPNSYK